MLVLLLVAPGAPFQWLDASNWFDTSTNVLCTAHEGVQCGGSDLYDGGITADATACCALCGLTVGCKAWTFNAKADQHCWLKTGCASPTTDGNVISGYDAPSPPMPGPAPAQCKLVPSTDCYGEDLSNQPVATPEACCSLCSSSAGCGAFTHAPYDTTGAVS